MAVVPSGAQKLNDPLFCRQEKSHLLVVFMTEVCELSTSIMAVLESGFSNNYQKQA